MSVMASGLVREQYRVGAKKVVAAGPALVFTHCRGRARGGCGEDGLVARPVVDHDRLIAMPRCWAREPDFGPACAIPLPHVAQRRIAVGRGAAIEQDDARAFVEDHSMGVASARAAFRRLLPACAVPDPGVVEKRLTLIRSVRRADAAEQHDLPSLAIVGKCRSAARRRALGRHALPDAAFQLPCIGWPRAMTVSRDPAVHQDATTGIFHQRVMVARRDVGDLSPAARVSFPTVTDYLPCAAVRRRSRTADDNGSLATGLVGGSGIDPAHRSGAGHSLPTDATPAPGRVVVAMLRIPRTTNEHDPSHPQVIEPHGVIGGRTFRGCRAVGHCWLRVGGAEASEENLGDAEPQDVHSRILECRPSLHKLSVTRLRQPWTRRGLAMAGGALTQPVARA